MDEKMRRAIEMMLELSDLLAEAERLDSQIFRVLPSSMHNEYEKRLAIDFDVSSLRSYAEQLRAAALAGSAP